MAVAGQLAKTQLATQMELGRTTAQEAFRHGGAVPSVATVATLARTLGLPVEELLGRHMFNNGNKRTAQAVVEQLLERNWITGGPTSVELRSVVDGIGKGKLHAQRGRAGHERLQSMAASTACSR